MCEHKSPKSSFRRLPRRPEAAINEHRGGWLFVDRSEFAVNGRYRSAMNENLSADAPATSTGSSQVAATDRVAIAAPGVRRPNRTRARIVQIVSVLVLVLLLVLLWRFWVS